MYRVGLDRSALDPSFKAHAGRGIGRYVQELSAYLDTHKHDLVEIGAFDYKTFTLPPLVDRTLQNLPLGRQTIRQQLFYPLQLKGKLSEFHMLHFPAHMDAPSWSAKPYILTVLDLIPLIFRHLYESDRMGIRFKFARWLEINAIKSASLILAISECTARDVTRILGIPPERIVVTPLGVDKRFFARASEPEIRTVRQRLGIPEGSPVLLYVGGIDQRKNIEGLLQTFQEVIRGCSELGYSTPRLVISGKIQNDKRYPIVLSDIKQRGLEELVVMPGYIEDVDLPALYGLASVFLFPSLYEGFGLPPLEAMAAGVPVVSSNASAMPEVIGESALLYQPERADEGARLVLEVIRNEELKKKLSIMGPERAKLFTWARTGELTIKAYEQAARAIVRR